MAYLVREMLILTGVILLSFAGTGHGVVPPSGATWADWHGIAASQAAVLPINELDMMDGGVRVINDELPRYIQLKYLLIKWNEDHDQCPKNKGGTPFSGFAAWAGWKATIAAAPAITTPPIHLAGNRSIGVQEFCPVGGIQSGNFVCVQEDGEIKMRVKPLTIAKELFMHMVFDSSLKCYLKDFSLYKIAGMVDKDGKSIGFLRFDFDRCEGPVDLGAKEAHYPTTVSMSMQLTEPTVNPNLPADSEFYAFYKAVCKGGPAANWYTAMLPKFAKEPVMIAPASELPWSPMDPQPRCFADTSNGAHVLGKGCFDDFWFLELQLAEEAYAYPIQARIPTKGYMEIVNDIPDHQFLFEPDFSKKTADTPQIFTQPPATKNPCTTVGDPCETQPAPELPCATLTTTTTTPKLVPGVVVMNRVCLRFPGCACNNDCDCQATPEGSTAPTTTTPPIPIPFTCVECFAVTLFISVTSTLVAGVVTLCLWTNCIMPNFIHRFKLPTAGQTRKEGLIGNKNPENFSIIQMTRDYMPPETKAFMSGANADDELDPGGAPRGPSPYTPANMRTSDGQTTNLAKARVTGLAPGKEGSIWLYWTMITDLLICVLTAWTTVYLMYDLWRVVIIAWLMPDYVDDADWDCIDVDKCPWSLAAMVAALALGYYIGHLFYFYKFSVLKDNVNRSHKVAAPMSIAAARLDARADTVAGGNEGTRAQVVNAQQQRIG